MLIGRRTKEVKKKKLLAIAFIEQTFTLSVSYLLGTGVKMKIM